MPNADYRNDTRTYCLQVLEAIEVWRAMVGMSPLALDLIRDAYPLARECFDIELAKVSEVEL